MSAPKATLSLGLMIAVMACLGSPAAVATSLEGVEQVVGIWDAVLPDEPRVFTVEVRADGPSVAAMVVGHKDSVVYLFECKDVSWRSSRLRMTCSGVKNADAYSLTISGKGIVDGKEGQLNAEFVLQNVGRTRTHSRWRAQLVNLEGNYLEYLVRMKQLGGRTIGELKRPVPK